MKTERDDDDAFTELLRKLRDGALDDGGRFAKRLYAELHRLASAYMRREGPDPTLQTTVLADDAYMKLLGNRDLDWDTRKRFLAHAAKIMRSVLVDYARRSKSKEHGGGLKKIDFSIVIDSFSNQPIDATTFLDLHALMSVLERVHPRSAQATELRFFTGLKIREIARAMDISIPTVENDIRAALAWLRVRLSDDGESHGR